MSLPLSERAVMCKRWRWRPGMLAQGNYRVVTVTQSGYPSGCSGDYDDAQCWELSADSLPDLDDAATLGCVLGLVRLAYGDAGIYCTRDWQGAPTWGVFDTANQTVCSGLDSEAAALVAALEKAK